MTWLPARELWKNWCFGLFLGGLMIAFQLTAMLIMLIKTPPGMIWMGNLVLNAVDYPVYLNYLEQGAHSLWLTNLYNNFPQVLRFDAFWSLGGFLVRLGLSAIQAHEILRWLGTMVLGLVVYGTAKHVTTDEHRARVSSLIILNGMSLGWLHAIIANLSTGKMLISIPPDVSSELSIAPLLTGGAHAILSLSLQLLLIRWVWLIVARDQKKYLYPAVPLAAFFAAFHPYFIPLMSLVALIALTLQIKKSRLAQRAVSAGIILSSMLPAGLYFLWLAGQDKNFSHHFLVVNQLNLHRPTFWLFSLLPILIAGYFLYWSKKISLDQYRTINLQWVWIWIAAALICLSLPFPWSAKYSQGLMPAFSLLTLPFWLWLYDKYLAGHSLGSMRLMLAVLYLSAPFLYVMFMHVQVSNSEVRPLFYQPKNVIQGLEIIKKQTDPDAVVLVDDLDLALWIPAKTLRRVWLGHEHETPDYPERAKQMASWRTTSDTQAFNDFLDKNNISILISNQPTDTNRYSALLKDNWSEIYKNNDLTAWQRN